MKNADITLSGEIKIIKQLKDTKAKFFKDLKVGDIVTISFTLEHLGHYAAYLNLSTKGQDGIINLNDLHKRLSCFEYEII